jgi:mono/diheme cytochrome c family protein
MRCIFLCIVIFCGAISEAGAQNKMDFDYPDDIVDSAKKAFVKQFNQGQVIYKITCAKCHTITENKKQFIPDFSLPQLMDYEMRFYEGHSDQLGDNKITDQEMQYVILFLRYKKKSGKLVRPGAVQ